MVWDEEQFTIASTFFGQVLIPPLETTNPKHFTEVLKNFKLLEKINFVGLHDQDCWPFEYFWESVYRMLCPVFLLETLTSESTGWEVDVWLNPCWFIPWAEFCMKAQKFGWNLKSEFVVLCEADYENVRNSIPRCNPECCWLKRFFPTFCRFCHGGSWDKGTCNLLFKP